MEEDADSQIKLSIHLIDHMYAKRPQISNRKDTLKLPDHAYSSNNVQKINEVDADHQEDLQEDKVEQPSGKTKAEAPPAAPKPRVRTSRSTSKKAKPKRKEALPPPPPTASSRRLSSRRTAKKAATAPLPERKPVVPKLTRYMAAISVRNIISSRSTRGGSTTKMATRSRTSNSSGISTAAASSSSSRQPVPQKKAKKSSSAPGRVTKSRRRKR